MIIFLLEVLAIAMIAVGVFYIAVPLGLIFVGLSLLAFTLAWERSKKVDNK
jgi:uncharacterized membrane protein